MATINPDLILRKRKQNSIKRKSEFSGIGIHTGKQVTLRFCPAEPNTGIVFKRIDLDGAPTIPARLEYVCDTTRSTTIGAHGVFVHTVEHVLAAVRAYEIDNLIIEVSDKEPPIGNGSSDIFVDMIERSEVVSQGGEVPIIALKKPVFWAHGDTHLALLPYEGFRISYTLHYPDAKALQHQFYSVLLTPETFKNEISPCRTFSKYEEVEYLLDRGLIKGGSLANTLIIKDDVVFSREGLFFPDEMARHKILDMIGDLSLIGFSLQAHLIGCRTGHRANYEFAKELLNSLKSEITT